MFKKTVVAALISTLAIQSVSAADYAGTQVSFQLLSQARANAQQAAAILASEVVDDVDGYPLPPGMLLLQGGPSGGGLIPLTSSAPKTDGTRAKLGYCVWDNGTSTAAPGRISGSNSLSVPVLAVIAPGGDGAFATTCAHIQTGTPAQGDDLVFSYSTAQLRAMYSLYIGASLPDAAALLSISSSALRDGELRLIKSDNTLRRWDSATASWIEVVGGSAPGQEQQILDLTKIASGTAATPSVAFLDSASATGLFYTGSGVGFSVGGVQVGSFSSTGLATSGITASGNISADGSLVVAGPTTLGGLLTANGGVQTSTISATGDVNIAGLLSANGGLTTSTFTSTGDGVVGGALNVTNLLTASSGISTTTIAASGRVATSQLLLSNLISDPEGTNGLLAYRADLGKLRLFNGSRWININDGGTFNADSGGNLVTSNVSGVRTVGSTPTTRDGITRNILMGEDAGKNLHGQGPGSSWANNNLAFGFNALMSSTTLANNYGTNNTALGSESLLLNSTGSYNLAAGYQALRSNTTGSYNIAIGYRAGATIGTANNNIAIGQNALMTTFQGAGNVALGFNALTANISGASNIALGESALGANLSGIGNFAAGVQSLVANRTGHYNMALMNRALESVTSGDGNLAIGQGAGSGLRTGFQNIFIGKNSGGFLDTVTSNGRGQNNVMIGESAGFYASNQSSGVVAIGTFAGFGLRFNGFSRNNAVGESSQFGSPTTANNIGVDNNSFGYRALFGVSSGSRNTAVGTSAGETITIGSDNTLIGYQARVNDPLGTFRTGIGSGVLVSSNNTVVLGRAASDVTVIGAVSADTTTAGFGRLQVTGNITPGTDNSFALGSSARRWSAVFSANGTIQTSDSRLKTNVVNIEPGEALAMVTALRSVRYNWTNPNDGPNRKIGFIAQELAKILPEAVYLPQDETGFLGVNYAEIVPALAGAIQAQQLTLGKIEVTSVGLRVNGEFEASILKAKSAEVEKLKAREIEAERIKTASIEAGKVTSGESQIAGGAGCQAIFALVSGAVYEVRSMADSGGWATMRIGMSATGPVIQAREASKDSALDLNVVGNSVCASAAAGQRARASWLRVM